MKRLLELSRAVGLWALMFFGGVIWCQGETPKAIPSGSTQIIDQIVIRIGNHIITNMEIDEPLAQLRARAKTEYRGQDLEEKMQEVRQQHIERMIETKLLLLEAEEQKVEIQDTMVDDQTDKEIEKVRSSFPSAEAYKEQLAKEHLTEAEFRKQRQTLTRESLLRQKLLQGKIQEFKTGTEIADDKLREYYQEHRAEFSQPARAHLSQIFTAKPEASLAADEYKRLDMLAVGKIQQALQEVRQGKEFSSVARRYSEHQLTAEKGGDIGWITEGDTGMPELEKTAFTKLKAGEVSGIVTTGRGYFIIRLEDLQKGGQLSFEEVRGRIRQQMMAEGSESRYQAWVDSLKKKFGVVYVDPAFKPAPTPKHEEAKAKNSESGEQK